LTTGHGTPFNFIVSLSEEKLSAKIVIVELYAAESLLIPMNSRRPSLDSFLQEAEQVKSDTRGKKYPMYFISQEAIFF
jgi:hypothetical protein